MRLSGRNDAELLLVVLFWAFNVTAAKVALGEMLPLAFNMIRFAGAALLLLAAARWREGSIRIAREDLGRILLLALIGHTIYQLCFVHGLHRTTASSTALIFGSTPVVVAILSRMAGHERIGLAGGGGALLAFYGVFLIVRGRGGGPEAPEGSAGPLLIVAAVVCWSIYTVLSRDLLLRYSPLRVTAVTLSIGALLLLPASVPDLAAQDWGGVSRLSWLATIYSLVFALVISYVLWYRSVKMVGNVRTAVYSNLVPVFGTLFGIWLLDERLTTALGFGAACILAGILLTRAGGRPAAAASATGSRTTAA